MEPNDLELRDLLREWRTPAIPSSLEERVLSSRRNYWRILFKGSIRVPVPVAACLAVIIGGMAWQLVRPGARQRGLADLQGTLPFRAALTNSSYVEPLDQFVVAAAQAHQPGKDGVGYPKCVYCPDPNYSDEAMKAHYEGTVVLQAVITAQGRAANIKVLKSPGMGLDKEAVDVVQLRWRFDPAKGPDGKPVDVVVPIEVTFRLPPKK